VHFGQARRALPHPSARNAGLRTTRADETIDTTIIRLLDDPSLRARGGDLPFDVPPRTIARSRNPLASGLPFPMTTIALRPIGRVESRLTDLADAPRQADEGAPRACLVIDADFADALEGLKAGDEVIVITWLDRAQRDILRNHPRGDPSRPVAGVFTTRSPHRPNPLGLHQVTVAAIDGARVLVRSLEAVDGTPILDIKGLLHPDIQQR
jgi:tRNA-Thr(GGU) m(6)t(6)A37 methyltransferase TsaA